MGKRIFKYKLDFYYKSLIIYFLFLVIYVLIRGNFTNEKFLLLYQDPIIYIISLFIILFLFLLIVYAVRSKQIIFEDDKIVLKNRFGEREIMFDEIIFIKFSRERGRRIDGSKRIRIVKLKLRDRKRYLRIRIGEFYDERKLIQDFRTINIKQR